VTLCPPALRPLQEERMQKCASVVADNFNTIRTGRANPAILDRIQVGTQPAEGEAG
jgi:ribosome recycling factor